MFWGNRGGGDLGRFGGGLGGEGLRVWGLRFRV